jgi:hypothetical protein
MELKEGSEHNRLRTHATKHILTGGGHSGPENHVVHSKPAEKKNVLKNGGCSTTVEAITYRGPAHGGCLTGVTDLPQRSANQFEAAGNMPRAHCSYSSGIDSAST